MQKILIFLITIILSINVFAHNKHYDTNKKVSPPVAAVVTVPMLFDGSNEAYWADLGTTLTLYNGKFVVIKVSGFGGIAIEAFKFYKDIEETRANNVSVIMRVTGPAYSAHAFLTCFASTVILEPGASLMFHSASSENSFLFGLIKYKDDSIDPTTDNMQNYMLDSCVKTGRLTSEDVNSIKNGKDILIINDHNKLLKYVSPDPERTISIIQQILALIINIGILGLVIALFKRI